MAKIREVRMKCGYCGTVFLSPIFIEDTETFDVVIMQNNVTSCPNPKCRRELTCDKSNMSYVLADGRGGSVGSDFPSKGP